MKTTYNWGHDLGILHWYWSMDCIYRKQKRPQTPPWWKQDSQKMESCGHWTLACPHFNMTDSHWNTQLMLKHIYTLFPYVYFVFPLTLLYMRFNRKKPLLFYFNIMKCASPMVLLEFQCPTTQVWTPPITHQAVYPADENLPVSHLDTMYWLALHLFNLFD